MSEREKGSVDPNDFEAVARVLIRRSRTLDEVAPDEQDPFLKSHILTAATDLLLGARSLRTVADRLSTIYPPAGGLPFKPKYVPADEELEVYFNQNDSNVKLNLVVDHTPRDPFVNKGFIISIDDEGFAVVEIMRDTFTVAWDGRIDFKKIDQEVLKALPKLIFPNVNIDWLNYLTKVVFFKLQKKVTYNLKWSQHRLWYQKTLHRPKEINFVRYDVGEESSANLYFAFASPNFEAKSETEKDEENQSILLELNLPRARSISEDLLQWIIDHHTEKELFKDKIDPPTFLNTLHTYTKPYPG